MEHLIEASEVGRDVVASVSASVLSSVICELVARYKSLSAVHDVKNNVLMRYNEQFQLEIHRERCRRSKDDEGFESDDDNGCSSSVCYMGQDHLNKLQKKMVYDGNDGTPTYVNSDSANSSGSSDSDDIETSVPVTNQCWIERFPITDVLFCHTEPRFPNTIAWVVKREKISPFDMTSRLGKSGVEHFSTSNNCLNVIVVKCQNFDDFTKLCDQYREFSRRTKLDQYKSLSKRKPIVLTCLKDTSNIKVSLSDIKVTHSNLLKASEISIPSRNKISLNALLRSDENKEKFNLLQRTDYDGMTHTEISKFNKSKIQKEIEGVIMSEVDNTTCTPLRRQRCIPSILPDRDTNYWALGDIINPDKPPERPERRKYLRKKSTATLPTPTAPSPTPPTPTNVKSKSKFYLPIQSDSGKPIKWPEPSQCKNLTQPQNERLSRKSGNYAYQERRRRTKSAGRTAANTPMAYRYIDVNTAPITDSNEFTRRRRNSLDDTAQFQLRPVIKTNKVKLAQDKYCEPKKVTFSAYATVQVVD